MDRGDFRFTLIITFLVIAVLFLVFREGVCWYWKINKNIALLTEIRDLLATAKTGAATLTAGASNVPAAEATTTAAAAARERAVLRQLAESVRDNPRLPIDEKIALLQRVGGQFSWEKGDNCKAVFNGHEIAFASGKEFGDWMRMSVIPELLRRTDA